MNKVFSFLLISSFVLLFYSCSNTSDNTYKISLTVEGAEDESLIIQQRKNGEWVKIDSAELINGKAEFNGSLEMPEFFYVTFKKSGGFLPVFAEAGNITVQATMQNLKEPVVSGSESHKIYDKFNASMAEIDELFAKLNAQYREAYQQKDEELMAQLEEEFDELNLLKVNHIKNFAIQNNTSVVAPYLVMANSYMFELEDLEVVSAAIDPSIAGSDYVVDLNDRIAILSRVAVGQPFVDFTLNDPEGNPLPLSSVIGENYVLVDFWASWCGPCRAENPNIVLAYNVYHDKGFDVFGVSFDKTKDKWLGAIAKDQLAWNQVSDLKFWSSEAGKLYGVQSIPHGILIDPNGIIIAKNLRGKELQDKLSELLD